MKTKFKKGEYVVYDNVGVCQIVDITSMKFTYQSSEKMYYILSPEAKKESRVYVPVDNEKKVERMRYVMTEEELNQVIADAGSVSVEWTNDKTQRAQRFKEILAQKNQRHLIQLANCIHQKRNEMQAKGKKLSSTDEHFLKEAERFVDDEFSFSLKLDRKEVATYIRDRLEMCV